MTRHVNRKCLLVRQVIRLANEVVVTGGASQAIRVPSKCGPALLPAISEVPGVVTELLRLHQLIL